MERPKKKGKLQIWDMLKCKYFPIDKLMRLKCNQKTECTDKLYRVDEVHFTVGRYELGYASLSEGRRVHNITQANLDLTIIFVDTNLHNTHC